MWTENEDESAGEKERGKESCGSECKRVGDWEQKSSREGDCERRLLYSYNKQFQVCYWPKPEWPQAVPVIHLYLLASRVRARPIQNLGGKSTPHSDVKEKFICISFSNESKHFNESHSDLCKSGQTNDKDTLRPFALRLSHSCLQRWKWCRCQAQKLNRWSFLYLLFIVRLLLAIC